MKKHLLQQIALYQNTDFQKSDKVKTSSILFYLGKELHPIPEENDLSTSKENSSPNDIIAVMANNAFKNTEEISSNEVLIIFTNFH